MSKSKVPPSVGRVVIYVWPEGKKVNYNNAESAPAVIVRTWENTSYENDEVNLQVLPDGIGTEWVTSVPHSETQEPHTWHWPPRAKEVPTTV